MQSTGGKKDKKSTTSKNVEKVCQNGKCSVKKPVKKAQSGGCGCAGTPPSSN